MGNTVCTPRTDEREEVGGQEVKNKRNTSDLSDWTDQMEEKEDLEKGESGCKQV